MSWWYLNAGVITSHGNSTCMDLCDYLQLGQNFFCEILKQNDMVSWQGNSVMFKYDMPSLEGSFIARLTLFIGLGAL